MSTAAVSSLSIYQEIQAFNQSRQADLKQLGTALQSGDLNGAQQAYQALAVLGEDGPFANSSRAQAFNTIGEALDAGDLGRAQAAFATLTAQGNPASASQPTPAAVVNLTSTQPGSATPVVATPAAATTGDASSIYQQLQAYWQQRQTDLTQLGQDLQAGNLNAAQQDFNTLTALGQGGPNKNGQAFSRADREQDFQAIGQALQSGDLTGAQSAFSNLSATFGTQNPQAQTAISAYNSNPAIAEIVFNFGSASGSSAASGSAAPEIVINLGNASGSTTGTAPSTAAASGSATPEIVINLGQGSGSSSSPAEGVTINIGSGSAGAQVSIDAAQDQSSSSAEPVTINLNPKGNDGYQNNGYELILNLLNSSLTSQSESNSGNALSVSA
jgi:Skp family chaperone for outer membrane proteins